MNEPCRYGASVDLIALYIVRHLDKTGMNKINNKPQYYNEKIIVSGSMKEIYFFEVPVPINRTHTIELDPIFKQGSSKSIGSDPNRRKMRGASPVDSIERSKNLSKYIKNQVAQVKRIFYANFVNGRTSFLSLTFQDNVTDGDLAKKELDKFIRSLRIHLRKEHWQLRYLLVPERQKRGAWHYHVVLFNVPRIKKELIMQFWPHGFVDIRRIERSDSSSQMVSKYMAKNFFDPVRNRRNVAIEGKKKRFFRSQNLIIPKPTNKLVKKFIEPDESKILYKSWYLRTAWRGDESIESKVWYFIVENER